MPTKLTLETLPGLRARVVAEVHLGIADTYCGAIEIVRGRDAEIRSFYEGHINLEQLLQRRDPQRNNLALYKRARAPISKEELLAATESGTDTAVWLRISEDHGYLVDEAVWLGRFQENGVELTNNFGGLWVFPWNQRLGDPQHYSLSKVEPIGELSAEEVSQRLTQAQVLELLCWEAVIRPLKSRHDQILVSLDRNPFAEKELFTYGLLERVDGLLKLTQKGLDVLECLGSPLRR